MAVYVDDFNIPYRGMKMSHMLADTKEELLAMADKIGVKRKWIQYENTAQEHFDICLAKKELAIKAGAILISKFETGRKTLERAAKMNQVKQEIEKR